MSTEEAVKPITDAIGKEIAPNLVLTMMSWGTSFVLTLVKCIAMFTTISVGMVYFKQEGMLYHPEVPEKKYRYPRNMPAGYRHPGEYGMEYEDCKIIAKDKT